MAHWDNNERREQPARFIPADGEPTLGQPTDLFVGDHRPNILTVDGHRHHVPAKAQPAWALAEIEAAAREGRAVVTRKIGSAGKFSFWEIVGSCLEEQRKLVSKMVAAAGAAKVSMEQQHTAALLDSQATYAAAQGWIVTEKLTEGRHCMDARTMAVALDGTTYEVSGGNLADIGGKCRHELRQGPLSLEQLADEAGMIVIDGIAYDDAMVAHTAAHGELVPA
jgi:hypothetical protein